MLVTHRIMFALLFAVLLPVLVHAQRLDSLLTNDATRIPGVWVAEYRVVAGGNRGDTMVPTYDTLRFFSDGTYSFSKGANSSMHWAGYIESGNWFLEGKSASGKNGSVALHLNPTRSNIPLPLTDYRFEIVEATDITFTYYYYDKLWVFRREGK